VLCYLLFFIFCCSFGFFLEFGGLNLVFIVFDVLLMIVIMGLCRCWWDVCGVIVFCFIFFGVGFLVSYFSNFF